MAFMQRARTPFGLLLAAFLAPALGGCVQNAPPVAENARPAAATLPPEGQTTVAATPARTAAAKAGQTGADASPVDSSLQ